MMTPEDSKTAFLPFHAINDYMFPEFRLSVLNRVLSKLDAIPSKHRAVIQNLLKRYLKVDGFRNASLAPLPVRVRGSVTVFEKHPEFVSYVLTGWVSLNPELAKRVFAFLTARGWELLPVETDRTKLPGFLTRWPKEEPFEVLDEAYHAQYPDDISEQNDIRLMVVWLSGRLPYELVEIEND